MKRQAAWEWAPAKSADLIGGYLVRPLGRIGPQRPQGSVPNEDI